MSENDGFLPPMLMVRSFLTIASGCVLHVVTVVGLTYLIGSCCFAEFQAFQKLPAEQQALMMESNPSDAIPLVMFAVVIAGAVPLNLLLGAYAVRTAPFSHQAHSIFLAVLLFVFYLQRSTTELPEKKTMTLITMVALPVAILLGGWWMIQRMKAAYWREHADSDLSDADAAEVDLADDSSDE